MEFITLKTGSFLITGTILFLMAALFKLKREKFM
jgi:hypothetical protein